MVRGFELESVPGLAAGGVAALQVGKLPPAIGALLMSLWLMKHPPRRHVGRTLLIAVAVWEAANAAIARHLARLSRDAQAARSRLQAALLAVARDQAVDEIEAGTLLGRAEVDPRPGAS